MAIEVDEGYLALQEDFNGTLFVAIKIEDSTTGYISNEVIEDEEPDIDEMIENGKKPIKMPDTEFVILKTEDYWLFKNKDLWYGLPVDEFEEKPFKIIKIIADKIPTFSEFVQNKLYEIDSTTLAPNDYYGGSQNYPDGAVNWTEQTIDLAKTIKQDTDEIKQDSGNIIEINSNYINKIAKKFNISPNMLSIKNGQLIIAPSVVQNDPSLRSAMENYYQQLKNEV